MATEEDPEETTVSARGMVTIPAGLRRRLGIEPGDKLRWTADEEGDLSTEIIHQREGVFDDFEAVNVARRTQLRSRVSSGRSDKDSDFVSMAS